MAGSQIEVFLAKRLKPLALVFAGIAAVCLIFVAASIILDARNKAAIKELEGFIERYNKLDLSGADGGGSGEAPAAETGGSGGATAEDAVGEADADLTSAFLKDISAFAEKYSGYPSAKAWSLAGGIYAGEGKWAEAEAAYAASGKAGKKAPIGGVSFFNAAVCAAEQGKTDEAIGYYKKAAEMPDFFEAAHARFAIGALYEKSGKSDEAKDAYQAVIDNYPEDKNWRTLATSALIGLETAR